jgi:hypothetical protein
MFKRNLCTKLHGITFQKTIILVFNKLFKDRYIHEEDFTLFE